MFFFKFYNAIKYNYITRDQKHKYSRTAETVETFCCSSKKLYWFRNKIVPEVKLNYNISIQVLFKAAKDLSFFGTHFTTGLNPDSCLAIMRSSPILGSFTIFIAVTVVVFNLLNCNLSSLSLVVVQLLFEETGDHLSIHDAVS